jgi:PAS domain S-box-containing protein
MLTHPAQFRLPLIVTFVLLTLAARASGVAAQDAAPKRILILFSSDSHAASQVIVEQALRSTLQKESPVPIEIYSEYLDAGRTGGIDYEQELVVMLRRKYEEKRLDLIMAVTEPAIPILIKRRQDLFSNTPIVFLTLDRRATANLALGANVTGIWGEINFKPNLELALKFHPRTKKVFVISGAGPWDTFWRKQVEEDFRAYASQLEVNYLIGLSSAELQKTLSALPPDSVVFFVTNVQDKAGNVYENTEVLSQVSPSSNAPIYGTTDAQMGYGIVGGSLLGFEAFGVEGARVGLRVLAGEKPETIAPHAVASVLMFDARELKRWGISKSNLPAGSIVKFGDTSLWSRYKWIIIGLAVAVIAEGLLIGQMLYADKKRRQAEQKTKRADQRLREIVSNVPGMVWETVIDPKTKERKTTFISDYVHKMLGYTPEEWLAQPPGFGLRLMANDDRERAKAASEAAITLRKDTISEHRWQAKDGRLVWIESHLSPVLAVNGTPEGLRGVSLDVTERKLAEDTLRETEERSLRAQQAARVGTWEWDVRTGESVWSDMIWDLLGIKRGEGPTTVERFLDSIHPDDRERAIQKVKSVLAGNDGEYYDEFRVVRPDGEVAWLSSSGLLSRADDRTPERMIGVNIDITKRKIAEETARETQEKEVAILNAIPDLMFLQTRDGVYLDYHASDEEQLLLPPEQYLGKNMNDVLPPELARKFSHYFKRAVETGETQIVEYSLTIQGSERWYEARLVTSGENILSVVRDITERKRSLDQLRESEERFGKAFRSNPQPMSITTLADGVYIDVNDSLLAMSGYSRQEIIGHSSLALDIWDEPQKRTDFMRQVVARGSLSNVETIFRTKSGSHRLLLSSAERVEIGGDDCVLITSSDITERIQAQQALAESEARFRNMADTAPVMIWMSGKDRLCTYFNQGWLNFTGRTMAEELGNGWVAGVHPDDYDRCVKIYTSNFDAQKSFEMEYRLRRADGVYRWILDSGTPRFSSDGEFLGYIGSCLDITERRESEQALRTAHDELHELKNQLEAENIYLQEEIRLAKNVGEMVGESDAIKYVMFKVNHVAGTDSTVLITGETGTGKELVARAIHTASTRSDRVLITVNCAALPANLIESELFGHEKGAFTGAAAKKLGRFELADGGTIFLDEVGELPLESQVKLLRVIQEGEVHRLGGGKPIKVDVRIIAATNRNLKREIEQGAFREDLWYRLNVFPITVPPLRQRTEDIPLLVAHFVAIYANKFGKPINEITPQTMQKMREHSWPGNIRELANVIERAVIYTRGNVLNVVDVFEEAKEATLPGIKSLEEVEREYIQHILEHTSWRIEGPRGAAKLLGLNPSTLRTRMIKLGIHKQNMAANN